MACQDSNLGLLFFFFFWSALFSVTVCVSKEEVRKQSKTSHKYKSDSMVFQSFFQYVGHRPHLKAYKTCKQRQQTVFSLFLERPCLHGAFSLYFLLSGICDKSKDKLVCEHLCVKAPKTDKEIMLQANIKFPCLSKGQFCVWWHTYTPI